MAIGEEELAKELINVLKREVSEGNDIKKVIFKTLVLTEEGNEVGYDLGVFLDLNINGELLKNYFLDDEELLYSFDNLYERDEVIAYLEGEVNKVFRVKTAQRTVDFKL